MNEFEQVAMVLEKVAAYLDAMESNRVNQIRSDRQKLANFLKEKYEETTGDLMDPEVMGKIADADVDILSTFSKLTDVAGTSKYAELGESSGRPSDYTPNNPQEAALVAADNFAQFLVDE